MLGVCFFVYLPFLPLFLLICSWRRRWEAKKRLQKKAKRKQYRMLQKKRAGILYKNTLIYCDPLLNVAALLAMKGLMLQEELTIDDAFKIMDIGQREPQRIAPAVPPKVLSEFPSYYF